MVFTTVGPGIRSQDVSLDSVAGAVQFFRRACIEQVGGYLDLPLGGIDSAAEILARMHGWVVRTLPDVQVLERRRTGSVAASPHAARRREGRRLYSLGYGPTFFAARCLRRWREPPVITGSLAALYGYCASRFVGAPVALDPDAVRFLRREQRQKLLHAIGLARTEDA